MTDLERITELPGLPRRAAAAHKGDFGRVLVVAGSPGMCGAAVLCGSAALRGGAGLVTVITPAACRDIVAAGNPCYMTTSLDILSLADIAGRADVVVAGPGLGTFAGDVVRTLLSAPVQRLVLDADALNAIGNPPELLRGHHGERILTPHPGEFARLTGSNTADVQAAREVRTLAFVKRFGGVLVLKGAGTLVCDGTRLYCNTTGNPGMATGGSGDVLAGLIGALCGQGLDAFAAAQLGVYLHGLAGDLAAAAMGEWSLMAADLLDYLPPAFLHHAGRNSRKEADARSMPSLPENRHPG